MLSVLPAATFRLPEYVPPLHVPAPFRVNNPDPLNVPPDKLNPPALTAVLKVALPRLMSTVLAVTLLVGAIASAPPATLIGPVML